MIAGGVVAVVPVRGLRTGKTRLAGYLPPEAREALTRRMLVGVIRAAVEVPTVEVVVVVSPDPEALALARAVEPDRVVSLPQDASRPGLDAAVTAGRSWAVARGAAAVAVLFGDLPLLTSEEVGRLVAGDAPIVLASDRAGTGTNALMLRVGVTGGGGGFRFQFGLDSFARHLAEARRLGLGVETMLAPGTAHDLDTVDDLRELVDSYRWQPWIEDGTAVVGASTGSGLGGGLDAGDGPA